MRNGMASAVKSKLGALFRNGQQAVPICTTLIELGHPQAPIPIRTDNSASCGIVNDSIRKNKSRSMDMQFFDTWPCQPRKVSYLLVKIIMVTIELNISHRLTISKLAKNIILCLIIMIIDLQGCVGMDSYVHM